MVTVNTIQNWHIQPLTAYRFLEEKHVNEFFTTGRLRLSSFSAFWSHKDEVRGDKQEGQGYYSANYLPEDGSGGHNFTALLNSGTNAFVLCTSLRNDITTFATCEYNSGIVIHDITSFALQIANCIGHYIGGMQGQCLYKTPPILEIDLGKFNVKDLSDNQIQEKWSEFHAKCNSDDRIFFIKNSTHQNQFEYRLIWFVDYDIPDHLFIECPKAIQYCTKIIK